MELQQAMSLRRSVRGYNGKKVEREKLEDIIKAALLVPSWKNSQTSRYYVVSGEETLSAVKATLFPYNKANTELAPVLIVGTVVPNVSGFNSDGTPSNEIGNGWGYFDCGLQTMNLLLKATELGLSTLVMGLRDASKLKSVLNIPVSESVVGVIAVGYSDISPEMPPRKSVCEIARFYEK
ncbi:nitroreductase family protein [Pumilibacter muris]|uniref:nitroreductase family protein n=1 Tax=Pumilibacter muris TaxID=2941510 RepID=UPI00203E61CF|nr:nitroreductase family protein [Pumilibacter muris]